MSKYYAPYPRRNLHKHQATPETLCQKCLGRGHYIFDCKNERAYVPRLSRTQLLERSEKERQKKHRKTTREDGSVSINLGSSFAKDESDESDQVLESVVGDDRDF